MYELGLNHAMRKPAILLTRQIEYVPFDLRHFRTIVYDPGLSGIWRFKRDLRRTLETILNSIPL